VGCLDRLLPLTGRGSASTRSGGLHPSPGKGSGLVMPLKILWDEGRSHGSTLIEILRLRLVSVFCLVPLPEGNTVKKEVIR
jgi:hypothetical protein